jgi:hypothetical protein
VKSARFSFDCQSEIRTDEKSYFGKMVGARLRVLIFIMSAWTEVFYVTRPGQIDTQASARSIVVYSIHMGKLVLGPSGIRAILNSPLAN